MTLTDSLSKLDSLLTERVAVPIKLLIDDYVGVAGSDGTASLDPSCELNYRLLATAWISPWGSVVPWLIPASSVDKTPTGCKITLRLPQSKVRHFFSDAALYLKLGKGDLQSLPNITRATLRLGQDEILQSLDSNFACNISLIYKHDRLEEDLVSHCPLEEAVTLRCPLFFDMPLRVLPLYVSNTSLPEIEYHISSEVEDAQFIAEVVSSPGEADIQGSVAKNSTEIVVHPSGKTVVQHLPCFETFKNVEAPSDCQVTVAISSKDGKLAKALYIKVSGGGVDDIPDAIKCFEIIGPPPRSLSLLGISVPGSIARTHFKARFSKTVPVNKLPYYVYPFSVNPSGHTADYGVVLPAGTQLKITLNPKYCDLIVEVCVETSNRVVWKR